MGVSKKEFEEIGERIRVVQRLHLAVDREVADYFNTTVGNYRNMVHGRRAFGEEYLILFSKAYHPNMNYIFYGIMDDGLVLPEYPLPKPQVLDSKKEIEEKIMEIRNLSVPEQVKMILFLQEVLQGLLEQVYREMSG